MGKQCNECGTELRDSAKFCSKCGSKCEELYQGNKVNQSIEHNAEVFSDKSKKGKKQVVAIITVIVAVCILVASILRGSSEVNNNNDITGGDEVEIETDEQNEEKNQSKEKDFSIIVGTWRQSSICYPGAADISEIGGGEIVISKMNEKEIAFMIRDYSGNPDYKVQEYKVTDYEITEEYGEYIITFTAEKSMRGTLTITELTGKEKTLELAIHSEEETYTRGTGFYNKVSSNVDVEDTKVSGESESQVDEEVEQNDVDIMDELLCLVGQDVHWYELGRMNEYEEHMEAVLKPWVLKLMEEHSFYSGTTMIKISEYDRNKRIYFVMIYDDLNSGNYAGFYVNLSNDEVTFSQGDSNVVIQ